MSHREQIRRFFIRHGCAQQDADDLTQQVYLRLCQAGVQPEDCPDSYRMRVCRLVLRDYLRWRYRERELFVPLDTLRDYPASVQELCDDGGFVQVCLQMLSDKQSKVIQMYFEQELSFSEIAELLGCTPSAVRKLYHRAITKLRKYFNVPDRRGGGTAYEVSNRYFSKFFKPREKCPILGGIYRILLW
jgi:RNA polymerase sigma factor (sigma-70 family)